MQANFIATICFSIPESPSDNEKKAYIHYLALLGKILGFESPRGALSKFSLIQWCHKTFFSGLSYEKFKKSIEKNRLYLRNEEGKLIPCDNFNPEFWGPCGWYTLESICQKFPLTPTLAIRELYLEVLTDLQYFLPCCECRKHYSENVKDYPPDLRSRKALLIWLNSMHNIINKQLGKRLHGPLRSQK